MFGPDEQYAINSEGIQWYDVESLHEFPERNLNELILTEHVIVTSKADQITG